MNNAGINPASVLKAQKRLVAARGFPEPAERQRVLLRLAREIEIRTDALLDALRTDLGKSPVEAYVSEIGFVLRDIRFAGKHLRSWMKTRRTRTPLIAQPGRAFVRSEPQGVILIVGPWNYPFQLLFSPLVAALAAGNAACLKPSEFAPATSRVVRELCGSAFPDGLVTVIEGGPRISARLVELPFNHIFFTGSTETGRRVAEAAARNIIPFTLELGGKSPCVVCADAPLKSTARRILWGKCLNAGQTCVAPDHVWVHESIEQALLEELSRAARRFVPVRPPDCTPEDYARIVNDRHFDRLAGLLEGATVFSGGERDRNSLIFAPAILTGINDRHPMMKEEIFGPLLPVLPFRVLDRLIRDLNTRPAPLAAYVFTGSRKTARKFQERVVAGGICVNDTVSHILPPDLPFGGVGPSGLGRYRGRAGFNRFSNEKAILQRGFFPDLPFRYPPYRFRVNHIKRLYKWLAG